MNPILGRAAVFARKTIECVIDASGLILAAPFTSGGRMALDRLHAHLRPRQAILPEAPLARLVPRGVADLRVPPLDTGCGNVSPYELLVLSLLARGRAPRCLFEIGTFDGLTALALAANAPDDAIVHTLDLPAAEESGTRFPLADSERSFVRKPESGARLRGSPHAAKVRQWLGDSGKFDFAPWRGKADLIFVDGSHACEYVRSDSLNALAMAAPGGLILWHDFGGSWTGVAEALAELRDGHPGFRSLSRIPGTTLACLEIPADAGRGAGA